MAESSRKKSAQTDSRVFDAMYAAYDRADLSEAANLFDAQPDPHNPQAALLRARIYLKQQSPRDAMQVLLGLGELKSGAEAQRLMLLGVAESRVGQYDAADNYFDRAAALNPQPPIALELTHWRGRRYLMERSAALAQQQLERMRPLANPPQRAMAATLESGILIQQERYIDACAVLMRMLEDLENAQTGTESWIWGMHTLSTLAREIDCADIRTFVKRRAFKDVWTADFAVNKLQTQKAVAWCYALEGDYFNAFRHLKLAGTQAPAGAWQAMISLDRAYLARCLGEERWFRDELAEADEMLARIRWRQVSDEESVALLIAAELFAPLDASRALNYLAQFSELPASLNPLLHFRTDRRLAALADYTSGIVQKELGNRQAAVSYFKKSLRTYGEIRYDWRAGRCALRLHEITGDESWLARAEEKLRDYPASWLYDDLMAQRKRMSSRSTAHAGAGTGFSHALRGTFDPRDDGDHRSQSLHDPKPHQGDPQSIRCRKPACAAC